MPKSLALPIVDAPGKDSWPIAGYTYLLVYMDQQDCTKGAKVVSFIKWGLSDGTKYATELDYVPLPDNVKQQVLAKLGEVTCQGTDQETRERDACVRRMYHVLRNTLKGQALASNSIQDKN
jgi:hypothetical protein